MSIITLTLNPALDKSAHVDCLVETDKMYCTHPLFAAGGGGINVSRVLQRLGTKTTAIGQASGYTGELLKSLLAKEGVPYVAYSTDEWTRENIVFLEESTNKQFRFGFPGPFHKEEDWQMAFTLLKNQLHEGDILVLSGSIPKGVPVDAYAQISHYAKNRGIRVVLDSHGEPFESALEEGVFLIKPNIKELGLLFGGGSISKSDAIDNAKQLILQGKSSAVVVSMGGEGALLQTKEETIQLQAPKVNVISAVGAGDSMVAGMCYALQKELSLKDVLRFGIACGTATAMTEGTELCDASTVMNLFKQIV